MCGTKKLLTRVPRPGSLLIKFADSEFVESVRALQTDSHGIVEFKCKLMLKTILNIRKDLA